MAGPQRARCHLLPGTDAPRLANTLLFKSTYFVSEFLLFSESCSGAADGRGPISVQRFIFTIRKLGVRFVRCRVVCDARTGVWTFILFIEGLANKR